MIYLHGVFKISQNQTHWKDLFKVSLIVMVANVYLLNVYVSVAARSFGKFQDSFLTEVHAEIASHINQEATEQKLKPAHGITIQDSDVLQPDPVRVGGLVRKDAVR
jgi:hypothetical protein